MPDSKGLPTKGDKMEFLGLNGDEWERDEAKKVFVVGAQYIVEYCTARIWSHYVKFEGSPRCWNGFMFRLIEEKKVTTEKDNLPVFWGNKIKRGIVDILALVKEAERQGVIVRFTITGTELTGLEVFQKVDLVS